MKPLVILAAGLALAGCSAQGKQVATAQSASIEEPTLTPCAAPDPGRACAFAHDATSKAWGAALAGDYQAQRNVAYALTAPAAGVKADPVQGCAWRMVILANRPADGLDDAGNVSTGCSRLSTGDLAQARAVAGLINRRVYGRDLPA